MTIATRKRTKRSGRINLRATPKDAELIDFVARLRGLNRTEFILVSVRHEAEKVLAEQNTFTLSAKAWKDFNDALDRPAQIKPKLQRLLSEPSIFEKPV